MSSRCLATAGPATPLRRPFAILLALKSCTNITITRHLHAHILKLGFSAHPYVATSLLTVYASTLFRDACQLFDEMPARGSVACNIMITGYSRRGDITTARILFDTMPLRDPVSWSAIIAAYMDNSLWKQGLALFRQMPNTEWLSHHTILAPVLAGCGRMGSVGSILGKSIHGFAIKNRWELNVELTTCLVDMYAKCGLLKSARSVFHRIKAANVATWTAFISGAGQHGYGLEALRMFDEMREVGVKPNELTFTAVLAACSRAGLVDDGRRCFTMMDEYGVRPRIQHFGCMVDLYGKAGMVSKAYEVIRTMPIQANVVVWGSFLSSCKLHGEFEMGEKVIDEVMRVVRPEKDGGVYSLISEMYVLGGKMKEAEKLRELMVKQNVRKVRASSFISSM